MQGVDALFAKEVVAKSEFAWGQFTAAFAVCVVLFFIIGVIVSVANKCRVRFFNFFLPGIVVAIVIGNVFGSVYAKPVEYETWYKITVEDSVQMTDFMNTYEILEREGRILTVRNIPKEQTDEIQLQ